MRRDSEEQLLRCMSEVLNQNGFRSEILVSDNAPMLLRCETQRQGKVQKDICIECSFLPMQLPGEETGILQYFITVFPNVPDANVTQLRKTCEYVNELCALGTFGFSAEMGVLYMKQNTLMDGSLELAQNVPLIADTISLMLASVGKFIDGLASVAFTGTPLEAAIDQELFPNVQG